MTPYQADISKGEPIPAPSPVAPEAPKATQGEPTAPERIWVTYDEKETPVAVETDDRDACKTDVEYIRADLVRDLKGDL